MQGAGAAAAVWLSADFRQRLRRLFPACDGRLRGFRREACRSAARSKSQLLSPAPLLPSQPSFCTFSITSFVTSPLPSWSCQPFVHDSTASGLLAAQSAPCPAAAARHFGEARGAGRQPRHALDVSRRWAGSRAGARLPEREPEPEPEPEPDCCYAGVGGNSWCVAQKPPPPSPPSSLAPLPSAKEFAPCPHRAFLQ